jgi:hypothetical protein
MKSKKITVFIILMLLCLLIPHLFSCTSSNQITPSPSYWNINQYGTIETNDLARLQKEVTFTIVLPKYFPDGKDYYRFKMISYDLNDEPKIRIEYYNLKNKKSIYIDETPLTDMDYYLFDSYPGLMETQANLNGKTVTTIAGIQIMEGEEKNFVMPRFNYMWHQNNLVFSGDIYGYNQTVARKIIESIIK